MKVILKIFIFTFTYSVIFTNLLTSKPCFRVYGYLGTWSAPSGWTLDSIDWDALTHILDAFAIPQSNGTIDSSSLRKATLINKAHSTNTKCIVSLGGGSGSAGFSSAVSSTYRTMFVNNIYNLVANNGYDGVDIDWEFPTTTTDRTNYVLLMQQLFNKFKDPASAKAYNGDALEVNFFPGAGYYSNGFDWAQLANYCDYLIQGGYDIGHGGNGPLRNPGENCTTDTNETYECSIDGYANYIVSKGFPRNKIILANPFYTLPGQYRYGDVISGGTFIDYNTTKAEARYSYYGTQYVNNTQAFIDKIAYVKNNNQPGIGIWEVSQIYPAIDLWQIIKTQSCQGYSTPTPTRTFTSTLTFTPFYTSTITPTMSGTITENIIDNFEDNEFNINLQGGIWNQWASASSSVTRTITSDKAEGNYAGLMSGNVVGTSWPSISIWTDLNSAGTSENLNGTTGLKLYMKGTKGIGTNVDFLIQIVSTNISDYSYWRYFYTVQSNWTYIEIPWNSFVKPGWGEGDTKTLNEILANVKAIQFAISDNTGGNANSIGNMWYIDRIAIYGGTPINTPTFSFTSTSTNTATNTRTNTPTNTQTNTGTNSATNTITNTSTNTITNTPTNTITNTLTNTRTNTPIDTNTPTNMRTNTPTMTLTNTRTNTLTNTDTLTGTPLVIWTNTNTPTNTRTNTGTNSATNTITNTLTNTNTSTNTITNTPTNTITNTLTNTRTNTVTDTNTPTNTRTNTATVTLTNTNTTGTPSPKWTSTNSYTNTIISTNTCINSPTNTASNTPTSSNTNIPQITFTATNSQFNTLTLTFTFTSTPLITSTPTATETQSYLTDLKFIDDIKIIIYPNPINKNCDLKIKFGITKNATKFKFKLYTTGFRLVFESVEEKQMQSGENVKIIEAKHFKNLASGIYYYVIVIEDGSGNNIKSRIDEIIIL